MIGFRCLVCFKSNLFLNKCIKLCKTREQAYCVRNVRAGMEEGENYFDGADKEEKLPCFIDIANKENLEIDELLTKPQDLEAVEKIFQEIAQNNPEVEKKLRMLLYEITLKREDGGQCPKVLRKEHWEELLRLQTFFGRLKYLNYLYKTENKKESDRIKDALRKRDKHYFQDLFNKIPHIYYGLSGYSLFLRIYHQNLYAIQDVRVTVNKQVAPPIIFDCSYDDYMDRVCISYCAKQIALSHQINRGHEYPCTIQLFNLRKDALLMRQLKNCIHQLNANTCSLEIYEESYLDMYPKERLLYLTPHTQNELINFRPDDIYIIGAFVDKGESIQLSLAKAKEQGLRMAKFPLDKYLLWRKGSKSLTLNNVLQILLDMRYYRNWKKAFRSIPSRNLT